MIVPSWTAVPTWKAVINVGAMVRPVDVDYDTMLLQPESVKFNQKTKAIIPVHLYGYRACASYLWAGTEVINDACQSHGLKNLGNAAWSFYPTKNLGAYGDGGAITTDNQDLADRIREIRDSNRLDELQAAFLRVKLKGLDEVNKQRFDNADTYLRSLSTKCIRPKGPSWTPAYHQYVIRVKDRDALKAHLARKGIQTLIHYPIPPHRLLGYDYDLPIADRLSQEVLSLPIDCSQDDVERVCEVINEYYQSNARMD